ncbi:MAG: uroporphyrinogen-III synthase, partial [Planctomycetales bacterium]|nr:uroporphyrinogen-III synthase [Planctomycetales bacterium]
EVIPGITAGLAAASFSGLPVTDREISSAVALITGQEDPAKDDSRLDYQSLARFPGTLMVYMGVTTAGHWTQRLIAAGKDPDTPVALIRRCTWPNQEQILCTLAEVADCVTPYAKFPPPVIAIVGEVARSLGRWNWFTCLPLHGQTVLVTRSRHQATELNLMLSDLGAEVLEQPAIETTAPASWEAVDLAIEQLSKYTHVIFTSSNGVRFFMERLMTQHADVRCLAGVRLVCVGPATAATLAGWRLTADAVPSDTFRAESILSMIMASPTAAATPLPSTEPRCLWVRTNRGRETVAETLTTAGAQVDEVVAYESSDVTKLDPEIELRLSRGEIHWVTATSSAIAQSAVRLLGSYGQHVRWASLSSLTTAALQAAGVNVSAEAKTATMPALVDAIRLGTQDGR